MKRKKRLIVLIVLLLIVIVVAAGYQVYRFPDTFRSLSDKSADEKEVEKLVGQLREKEDKKVLVTYFSYSGTTKGVASAISERTGADLFEIKTKKEYTDVYTESNREIRKNEKPELSETVEQMEAYDIIFVGYPVWWHATPTPVNTFLESYDLKGKLIIPFCTSGESDIEETMPTFLNSCEGLAVHEGKRIQGTGEVGAWLEELDLGFAGSGQQIQQSSDEGKKNSESKILITYFTVPETDGVDTVSGASRVATDGEVLGNTEFIAKEIQKNLGGDLFAIETVQKYPGEHQKLLDFAYEELGKNARPELSRQIENLDSYDMVLVGYPNWNADLPMPLYTFFETYDFAGKTIIPFVTHGGSGFSNTVETIKELEPDANVISEGLSVSRNDVAKAQADVKEWTDALLKD